VPHVKTVDTLYSGTRILYDSNGAVLRY